MGLLFPCPGCGLPFASVGRCPGCATVENRRIRESKPHHHDPESRRQRSAARFRWIARAERERVAIECARCHRPINHKIRDRSAKGSLHVGHKVAGDNAGGYQPEHKWCNESAGAS